MDEFVNSADPLKRTEGADLFLKLTAQCVGHDYDEVASAALNLLLNALRQKHDSRMGAEAEYSEKTGRAHQMLLGHYDSVTGRRLSVFPHTQRINMPLHLDPDFLRRH